MAGGPFQTSGNNAGDLTPVNLQGGFTPVAPKSNDAVNAVESVTQAVGTIATLNTERLKKESIANIRQEVKAVRDALQISKYPTLQTTYFSEEALQDPYIKSVYKNFQEIKGATDQGRLSQEFAIERMEALMSQAINRRPQFADDIRNAANTAAGANISSKLFSQIMTLTPQQKALQELQAEATKLGIPVETYQGMVQQQFFREQMSEQIEYAKKQGTASLNDLSQQVGLEVTNATRNLQNGLLERIRAGGVVDVPVTVAEARQEFTVLRNKVLSNIPANVPSSQVSQVVDMIDAEEQRIITQIENGTMAKVLQTKGTLFEEIAKDNARTNAPDEMQILAIFGNGQSGYAAVNDYTKYKNNPQAMAGLYAVDEGGVLTVASAATQQYKAGQILFQGKQAANDQERRLAGYFGGIWLQKDVNTQGENPPPPQQVLRVVDVVSKMGEEYSTATLGDAKVAASLRAYKETHPQLINHFNSDVHSLKRQYQQLKAEGAFTDENVQIKNGRVSVTGNTIVNQFGAGSSNPANITGGTGSITAIQRFLRHANLTMKMGQTYQGNGVFPESVFRNSNAFLKDLKDATDVEPADLTGGTNGQDEVIRYDFDGNGKLIRLE